jgi:hypothetical protein
MRILKLKNKEELQITDVAGDFIWDNYLKTGKDGHLKLPNGRIIRAWDISDISEPLPDEMMDNLLPEHKNDKIPEKGIEYLRNKIKKVLK